MKKINTIAILALFLTLTPKVFSLDLSGIYANVEDTIYTNENFNINWGCTVVTGVGETRSALTIKANFYLSKDLVLDTTDYFIGTSSNTIASDVSYFSKPLYDLKIDPDQFPLGKQYLIISVDPDNTILEDYEDNTRSYDIFLFTRQTDLSFLTTRAGKNKNQDSSVVIRTQFYNSGSTTITNFTYNLSIANTVDDLSNPLYSYNGSEQSLTTQLRERGVDHVANLGGLGISSSGFVVKWEIISATPADVDATNNTVIKTFSWANLETIDLNAQIILMTNRNDTISTCNAIIYDDGGEDKNYSHNIRSTIRIMPLVEGKKIKLRLKGSFGLFGFDDILRFYNPDDLTEPTNLYYHANRSSLDYTIGSDARDGSIIINFITDASSVNKGFEISAVCVDTHQVLMPVTGNKTITTCKDTIYDDGGYGYYSNNTTGSFTIFPEEGKAVQLYIDEFNTTSSSILKVFDGISASGTPIVSLSGLNPTVPELKATNDFGALTIEFRSDYNRTLSGFVIHTSCFTPALLKIPTSTTDTIYSCDTTVYDNGGLGRYANNSNGTLVLYPKNTTDPVNINFESFDTQLSTDVFKVYSGNSTSGILLATLSGTDIPSLITSTDLDNGALTLQFISNDTMTAAGFKINVGCAIPTVNMIRNTTVNIKTCRSTIYDNGGDGNYPDNSNDVLIIEPDRPGAKVQLEFQEYATETGYDFLSIYDGLSATGTPIARFSGSTIPQTLYVASNSSGALTLKFTSDNLWNGSGFIIKSTCDLGNIVGMENEIESTTTNNSTLIVYPQPTSGTFKLLTDTVSNIESLFIYNSNGQVIYQTHSVNPENIQLPETITAGFYILEVKQGTNITSRTTLIVE